MSASNRPNLRVSKTIALEYIDNHRFMPEYVKDLAKQIVVQHFQSMSGALGALELATHRALAGPDEERKRKREGSEGQHER